MPATIVPIAEFADSRLAAYANIAQPAALLAAGRFVAEGRLVVARLVASSRHRVQSLLLSETAAEAMTPTLDALDASIPAYVVPQQVMNDVVGFNIHRGCLALAHRPTTPTLGELPWADITRLVVAEGVNNPDNVGGLFRNAAAFGASVVLGPSCGDPLYRKAIRTSMGASLTVPWAEALDWPRALDTIRAAGFTVLACTPSATARSLYDLAAPARAAVLVGAEGDGLTEAAMARADVRVRIPMCGDTDSLNVATAAAVVLSRLADHRPAPPA